MFKLHFYVSMKTFPGKFFPSEVSFLHQFGILSEKFSAKTYPTGLKILNFTCPVAIFDEKRFFLKKKLTIFCHGAKTCRLFAKHFQRGCQNCIGCVIKNILRTKVVSEKSKISTILVQWSNYSRLSGNSFGWICKSAFYVSKEQLR